LWLIETDVFQIPQLQKHFSVSRNSMGLDASVYCNCYKIGKIKSPPPHIELVEIDYYGGVFISTPDDEKYFEFEKWKQTACEHEDMVLLHCRIGNISMAGHMVSRIKPVEENESSFPVLLQKVFYSGTHAGDHLEISDVVKLQQEVQALKAKTSVELKSDILFNRVLSDLDELCDKAIETQNPIVFI
jgi:hypothetical protein